MRNSSVGLQFFNSLKGLQPSESQSPTKMNSADRKALEKIKNVLQNGESILLTKKIIKINRWRAKQYRTIAISNLHLYTFREGQIRRKVALSHIEAVSVSLTSNQFVLHIPTEYDLRYFKRKLRFCSESRVRIIHLIAKTRNISYIYSKKLLIYAHQDENLERVTVTQDLARSETYRRLYLCQSTPINCKLDALSLEINRRVKTHKQGEGDVLFMENEFADQFFCPEMQHIMNLFNADSYICTLVRCIKSKKLYTCKQFHKNTLSVSVDFFRNSLLTHQNNRFKEHLYCATQLENCFVLIFRFYTCGDLYGQMNFKQTWYPESVLKHIMVRAILGINRLQDQDYQPFILENILVDRNGNTFIADYIHFTQEQGSQQYLSPEQVTQIIYNSQDYDSKMCNFWRLGILIYEFAFGVTPISLAKLIWSIQKKNQLIISFPKRQQSYSEDFKQTIKKLLSLDPKVRPGFNGMKDYFQLPFFKDVDWMQYEQFDIPPPVKYHHTDIEYEAYEFGGAKILFE